MNSFMIGKLLDRLDEITSLDRFIKKQVMSGDILANN